MDAQSRRRERRAEKQVKWKEENPLLVGVSARPNNRPILSLTRKVRSRVEAALNPPDLTELVAYQRQIESRADAIERSQKRIAYKDVNPLGNKIHAVQKMKLSSKPLI